MFSKLYNFFKKPFSKGTVSSSQPPPVFMNYVEEQMEGVLAGPYIRYSFPRLKDTKCEEFFINIENKDNYVRGWGIDLPSKDAVGEWLNTEVYSYLKHLSANLHFKEESKVWNTEYFKTQYTFDIVTPFQSQYPSSRYSWNDGKQTIRVHFVIYENYEGKFRLENMWFWDLVNSKELFDSKEAAINEMFNRFKALPKHFEASPEEDLAYQIQQIAHETRGV